MTHTLITFLGKAGNYQKTTYRFPDNETATTRFFGLALRRKLQADRLVMFGTSGSNWEVVFLDDDGVALTGPDLDAVDQVITAVRANHVTQELLDPLAEPISRQLGFEVRFRVIGYAEQMEEQLNLLQAIAAEVKTEDRVSLDVTHGFRHLPMLALISALHLKTAQRVKVEGLYYGAFEMKQKEVTPVMNLKGLLRIADWVGALNTFDKDGDYGVFADLMEQDGVLTHQVNYLRRAAFRERISNVWEARPDLRNLDTVLDSGLPGVSALFADQLRTRIRWHKGQDLKNWQRDLAIEYLGHGDYIRSVIFALEGFETSLVDSKNGEDESNFSHREKAVEEYWDGSRGQQAFREDYALLNGLRNALAHGTRPKSNKLGKKIERVLSDPNILENELRGLIKKLLPR